MRAVRIARVVPVLLAGLLALLALPAGAQQNPPATAAPATPAVPLPTPETLAHGHKIMLAAAMAAGGESLRSVTSLEFVEKGTTMSAQGPLNITAKWQIAYPDKVNTQITLPMGQVLQVYNGTEAWIQSPQGIFPEPAAVNGEFQRGISLFGGWGLYQAVLAGKAQGQYLGEEEMDGKKAETVNWTAPFGVIKLYFDPASHLLIAANFTSTGLQGPVEAVEHWSDFRTVGGRQFPYHTMIYREGSKISETTVQEVNVNPTLDPALFAKPAAAPTPQQP